MTEINYLVNFGVPVIVSLFTYAGVRHQYKTDLKKQSLLMSTELEKIKKQTETDLEKVKRQAEMEIEKVNKQCQNELDKINAQLSAQGKLYEMNAQTDFVKEIMGSFMKDPDQAFKSIGALQKLGETIKPKSK